MLTCSMEDQDAQHFDIGSDDEGTQILHIDDSAPDEEVIGDDVAVDPLIFALLKQFVFEWCDENAAVLAGLVQSQTKKRVTKRVESTPKKYGKSLGYKKRKL